MNGKAWRTMNSAPKDGTKILVWNTYSGMYVASYRLPNMGEPQYESHYKLEWRDDGGRWATPKCWQELPDTPLVLIP